MSTISPLDSLEPEPGSSRSQTTCSLGSSRSQTTSCSLNKILYTTEGFKLWRALISVRANLNFVDSRNFSANLSLPVHQLKVGFGRCHYDNQQDYTTQLWLNRSDSEPFLCVKFCRFKLILNS